MYVHLVDYMHLLYPKELLWSGDKVLSYIHALIHVCTLYVEMLSFMSTRIQGILVFHHKVCRWRMKIMKTSE